MKERKVLSLTFHRKLLILFGLLKASGAIHYSAEVPTTRWGDAITRLLAERGWTRRQLAEAASVRPNTVTNLIKHSKDSDTATLGRIAAAFKVDVAELFLTKEQSVVLRAHQESRVDRLTQLVVRELSDSVSKLVTQQLAKLGDGPELTLPAHDKAPAKRRPARRRRTSKSSK